MEIMEVLLIIILNMWCLANAQSNSGIWQSGKWISGSWNSNKWISSFWNSNADYSSTRNSYISSVKSNSFVTMSRAHSIVSTAPTFAPTIAPQITFSNRNSYISIVKSTQFITTSSAYSIVLSAPQTSFSNRNSYISIVKSNPFVTTSSAYSIVLSSPTLIPTLIPTTLAPYPNQKNIIFETTSTLSGFPEPFLSEQEQVVYIIAFSASIHIDSEMVKIVKQEIANRRLTYNIDVTTRITYPYVSDPQTAYNNLVQQIQDTGTNFTDILKSVSLKMGITSFNNVSIIEVQVSPLLNYDDETGEITPRHQVGTLLVVIMIVSASSVVVAFFVYLYKKHRQMRMTQQRMNEQLLNLRRISEQNEKCVTDGCVTDGCVTDGCVTDWSSEEISSRI